MRRIEFFIICMFLISFVSASFQVGNLSHSIDTYYGPQKIINGWINISLNNEPSDSLFRDSSGKIISLINLLKINEDVDYKCTNLDCEIEYIPKNGQEVKSFYLSSGGNQMIGLTLQGNILNINSINFTVESDVGPSCTNQLQIDFTKDGLIESGNSRVSNAQACNYLKTRGCFSGNKTLSEFTIGTYPSKHCQRIKLTESPGFKLGAWVNPSGDTRNLTMGLYNLYGEKLKDCKLPSVNQTGEFSCDVEYLVTESQDYFVCIYSEKDQGTSKIRGYQDAENGCGFYGSDIGLEIASFDIFAQGKSFDSIGKINITSYLEGQISLNSLMSDYIIQRYGSLDCSNNCVIPIVFYSGANQNINISNLKINYDTTLGPTISNKFYNLDRVSSNITADFQQLQLNPAQFLTPNNYGEKNFTLTLNNKSIFTQKIFIERIPILQSIKPTKTVTGYPTDFKINAETFENSTIVKYEWNFGGNSTNITSVNTITHTFENLGQYDITVTITDSKQRVVSKTFSVTVGSPKEIIEEILAGKQADLSNVLTQINTFTPFVKKGLEESLDTYNIEGELKGIQTEFYGASSVEEYNVVLVKLLAMDIPKYLVQSMKTDKISFYPTSQNINLDILQLIGGGDYSIQGEEAYIKAIQRWGQTNLDVKIIFEGYDVGYESSIDSVLKVFTIEITKKGEIVHTPYLILKKLENLKLKENYLDKEESGYIVIELIDPSYEIVFSTTENVDFTNLPLFISPALERLNLEEEVKLAEEKKFKLFLFMFILFLLIILGIVAYIILQEWYKKKYEDYLFKNKNHLFNLINYIQNAKQSGMSDQDITLNLKKEGWTMEQITYVLRKYAGKRTGMVEIPHKELFEKLKNLPSKVSIQKKPIQEKTPFGSQVAPRGKFSSNTQKFNKL